MVAVGGSAGSLEPQRELARHLAGHTDLGEDTADEQARTADWAAGLSESLRAQILGTPEK